MLADQADHVLGVDTHRDSHSAAILAADTAIVQGQTTTAANERGYRRLLRFARENAPGRRAWAVEGTGSYGAGLTVFLHREGELVLEVDRPRRPARRDRAKSDELDAIRAAKEALTREHLARPRQRGEREALRVLLATRESAVKSKRAAITLMKGLLVSSAPSLREGLRGLATREQLDRCARLRISPTQTSEQRATIIAIRASARRATALREEALELEREIEPIVERVAPSLLTEMGVGPIVAAQILCAYSHTGRIRSEAAFARTRRRRTHPSVIRTNRPSPPRPKRRPTTQPSAPHDRPLPHARRPPNPRLHRPPPSRRTQHPRNQALPQALPRQTPLQTPQQHTPESRK